MIRELIRPNHEKSMRHRLVILPLGKKGKILG